MYVAISVGFEVRWVVQRSKISSSSASETYESVMLMLNHIVYITHLIE